MSTKEENTKLDGYVNDIKIKVRERSKNIEANVVGNFWKNPKYYFDYSQLKDDNFNNPVWKLFFKIGKKMTEKGYTTLTDVDVELFLQNSKGILDRYNEFGGYSKISVIMDVCNPDNLDAHIDEVLKWNACYNLVGKMTISDELIDKICELNADDVYQYY